MQSNCINVSLNGKIKLSHLSKGDALEEKGLRHNSVQTFFFFSNFYFFLFIVKQEPIVLINVFFLLCKFYMNFLAEISKTTL